MHAVSLQEEIQVSLSKQGKAALQKLAAWPDRVQAHYWVDMSDSSLPPILKPAGWQDCHHSLYQVNLAVTEGHQGGVRELPWQFQLT